MSCHDHTGTYPGMALTARGWKGRSAEVDVQSSGAQLGHGAAAVGSAAHPHGEARLSDLLEYSGDIDAFSAGSHDHVADAMDLTGTQRGPGRSRRATGWG
jgi:hypothetical protein